MRVHLVARGWPTMTYARGWDRLTPKEEGLADTYSEQVDDHGKFSDSCCSGNHSFSLYTLSAANTLLTYITLTKSRHLRSNKCILFIKMSYITLIVRQCPL